MQTTQGMPQFCRPPWGTRSDRQLCAPMIPVLQSIQDSSAKRPAEKDAKLHFCQHSQAPCKPQKAEAFHLAEPTDAHCYKLVRSELAGGTLLGSPAQTRG